MKNVKIAILSLLVCSSAATAESDPARAANTVILDKNGVQNLRIETEEAEERDFETTVFAIGRIEEIPANHSVLSSRIPGRVVELNVFEGDHVKAGQVLAKVESRQLGDPPPSIELKAPQDGLIITSHIRLGQPVEPDAELLDIADRSKMWAIAKIPEQEAALVREGSTAHLRIPALGNGLIDAKLTRFGVTADRQAGTVEGIFELDNADGRLRPGMRVEFSIVLSRRSDVLTVPIESVQGDPANRIVFVKDFDLPNAFVRAPVILGEQNEAYVEVLGGLFPGDEVVTRGSYSLGFAGGGSGISLKEALDAAHGHEHNEDGSIMTDEQKSAKQKDSGDGHAHGDEHGDHGELNQLLLIATGVMTFLSIILAQLLWRKSKKTSEE